MLAILFIIQNDFSLPTTSSQGCLRSMSLTGLYVSLSLVTKSWPTLATPWIVACQAPLCVGFSRQEYWSGLPFTSPADLPDPGIESRSPALQADSLLTDLLTHELFKGVYL